MDEIKKGDYVKIIGDPNGDLNEGYRDMSFEVVEFNKKGYSTINTTKAGGDNYWYIYANNVKKVTDLDCVKIGDILKNGNEFRRVLDIYGTYTIILSDSENKIQEVEDLDYYLTDGERREYFREELKKLGYKIYIPEEEKEIKEVTMEEVCQKFGETIKIKK